MPLSLQLIDASAPSSRHTLTVDPSLPLGSLRSLLPSLPLPCCERAAAGTLAICFDGKLLTNDEATLEQLGVAEAPVLVLVLLQHSKTEPASHQPSCKNGGHDVEKKGRSEPSVAAPPQAEAPLRRHGAPAGGASQVDTAVMQNVSGPPTQAAVRSVAAATEAPARANSATELPDDALCRICFSAAYENGLGGLISPCLCSGSMRFVHVACLNSWRVQSANERSFYECEQCRCSAGGLQAARVLVDTFAVLDQGEREWLPQLDVSTPEVELGRRLLAALRSSFRADHRRYRYKLARTKYAAYLEDVRLVRAVAIFVILLSIALGALLLGPFHLEVPSAHPISARAPLRPHGLSCKAARGRPGNSPFSYLPRSTSLHHGSNVATCMP